jgi:hypothetical protein
MERWRRAWSTSPDKPSSYDFISGCYWQTAWPATLIGRVFVSSSGGMGAADQDVSLHRYTNAGGTLRQMMRLVLTSAKCSSSRRRKRRARGSQQACT